MKKPDSDYQVSVSLPEWRLLQRLRLSRKSKRILLIDSADCREVGSLPAQEESRRGKKK